MSDTIGKGKAQGPKGSLGYFHRPRDNQQIWIFSRRGESRDKAIQRVTSRHGATPDMVTPCNQGVSMS